MPENNLMEVSTLPPDQYEAWLKSQQPGNGASPVAVEEMVTNQTAELPSDQELVERWDETHLPNLARSENGELLLEGKSTEEWPIESLQIAAGYIMNGAHEFPNRGTLNQVFSLGLELQNRRAIEEKERQAREQLMSEMTKTTRAESAVIGDEIFIPINPENQKYPSVLTEDGMAALEYVGESSVGDEDGSVSAYVFRIVRPCTIVKNDCAFAMGHGSNRTPFSERDVICKDQISPEHLEQPL